MACEMETVLPSFVLVMAMPILGWPLVRVIEVDGASVCSTVATAPSVMGVGLTVGVCVVVGSGEALLVPAAVEVRGTATPTTRLLRSLRELKGLLNFTRSVCPFGG